MIVAPLEARKGYQPFARRPLTFERLAVSLCPAAIKANDECRIMNDELKKDGFSFHSAFRIHHLFLIR
jgi:hypothetical protein